MKYARVILYAAASLVLPIGFPLAQSANIQVPREVGTAWEYAIHTDQREIVALIVDTNTADSSIYISARTTDTVYDFTSKISIQEQTESTDSVFLKIEVENRGNAFIKSKKEAYSPPDPNLNKPETISPLRDIDTVFDEILAFAKTNHNCLLLPEGRRKAVTPMLWSPPPFSSIRPFFSSNFLETCASHTWQLGAYWKNFDPLDSINFEIWRNSIGLLYKNFNFRLTSDRYSGIYEQWIIGSAELKRFKGMIADTTEWIRADAEIQSNSKNSEGWERVCEGSYYRSKSSYQPVPENAKVEISVSQLPAGISFHPAEVPNYKWSGFIPFRAPDWSYQVYLKYPLRTDTITTHVSLVRNQANKLILDSVLADKQYTFKYFPKNDSSACGYNPIYSYGNLPSWLHPVRKFDSFRDTTNLVMNDSTKYDYWERPFSLTGVLPERKDFEFQAIACLDSDWASSYYFGGSLAVAYHCNIPDTSIIKVKMIEAAPLALGNKRFNQIAFDGGKVLRIQSETAGRVEIVFRDIRGKILDSKNYQVNPGENTWAYSHRFPAGLIIISAIWPDNKSTNLVVVRK
jgi:hypothetical protein